MVSFPKVSQPEPRAQSNLKITVTLSFTYKRQMMQTEKPSMRLKRAIKHLLPFFDPVY